MFGSYWIDENGWPCKGPHGLWQEGEFEAAMISLGWRNVSKMVGVNLWERPPLDIPPGVLAGGPEGRDVIRRTR